MKRRLLLTCVIFLFLFDASAQKMPEYLWGRSGGGRDVTADTHGNIYTVGAFEFVTDINNQHFISNGGYDILLSKLDMHGNYIWHKVIGGSYKDLPNTLSSDAQGNVYLLGNFQSKIILGTDTLSGIGNSSMFLSKSSPNGDILWSLGFDNTDNTVNNITTDKQGNVYLGANIYCPEGDTLYIGNQQFIGRGNNDIYIIKVNSAGSIVWAKQEGGKARDYIFGIATDDSGSIYTTGSFTDTAYFDTTMFAGYNNGYKIFICKYDNDGNMQFAKSPDAAGTLFDIKIANDGSVYVSGRLDDKTVLGNDTLDYNDGSAVLIKHDNQGNILWARNYPGASFMVGLNIALNGADVYMNISYGDASLVKYNDKGVLLWSNEYGPHTQVPDIVGLCHDNNNGVLVTGYYQKGNHVYGNDTLPVL